MPGCSTPVLATIKHTDDGDGLLLNIEQNRYPAFEPYFANLCSTSVKKLASFREGGKTLAVGFDPINEAERDFVACKLRY